MHSVRRRPPKSTVERRRNGGTPLPLRWAVIITAAGAVGFAINNVAGPVAAVTAGATVAGLLHEVLA
jgi:hypothetical protein